MINCNQFLSPRSNDTQLNDCAAALSAPKWKGGSSTCAGSSWWSTTMQKNRVQWKLRATFQISYASRSSSLSSSGNATWQSRIEEVHIGLMKLNVAYQSSTQKRAEPTRRCILAISSDCRPPTAGQHSTSCTHHLVAELRIVQDLGGTHGITQDERTVSHKVAPCRL